MRAGQDAQADDVDVFLDCGADNLLRTDRQKLKVRFSIINLTNTEALYNFLSTFSGTHFVSPRAYTAELGFHF